MSDTRSLLEHLLNRRDLAEAQAGELLLALTDASLAPAMAGALLAALRAKGVTADEVRGFATAMRRHGLVLEQTGQGLVMRAGAR